MTAAVIDPVDGVVTTFPGAPSAPETPRSTARDVPAIGALVAFGLCALVTLVGAIVSDLGWAIGPIGVPAAMVLAWRWAPTVAAADRWTWRASCRFAGRVIAVTDLIVVTGILLASAPAYLETVAAGPSLAWAGDLIVGAGMFAGLLPVFWVIGLIFFGWMAAVFVIPLSWVWGRIFRTVIR